MISGWYEDLIVGEEVVTAGRTVTEADIVNFAALSGDWHPLHCDIEYAKAGPFGERIGHGALAVAIITGLVTIDRESVMAFYGMDKLRFAGPTRINDTVHVVTKIIDKTDRDERSGTVSVDVRLLNQRDELVLVSTFKFLVARKVLRQAQESA